MSFFAGGLVALVAYLVTNTVREPNRCCRVVMTTFRWQTADKYCARLQHLADRDALGWTYGVEPAGPRVES